MSKLSLVAFYGQKPELLTGIINVCLQEMCKSPIARWFVPYSNTQMHATIIGLEWLMRSSEIINRNYFQLFGKKEGIIAENFPAIINKVFPLNIRLGGFNQTNNDFQSFGKTPFERSFLIDRKTHKVILMGWPHEDGNFQNKSLAGLRSKMEKKCKIAHKYSNDNDFYLVLGKLHFPGKGIKNKFENLLIETEKSLRDLVHKNPVDIRLEKDNLSFVSYSTTDLYEQTSEIFPLESYYSKIDHLIDILNRNKQDPDKKRGQIK